jgi:hypothetical protein
MNRVGFRQGPRNAGVERSKTARAIAAIGGTMVRLDMKGLRSGGGQLALQVPLEFRLQPGWSEYEHYTRE